MNRISGLFGTKNWRLFLSLFFWGGLLGIILSWWRVRQIECWLDQQLVAPEQCVLAKTPLKQNMLWLDLNRPEWRELSHFTDGQNQDFELQTWHKRLPQTLVLKYISSSPVFLIQLPDQSWWQVNQAGSLMAASASVAAELVLPKIALSQELMVTAVTDQRLNSDLLVWLIQLEQVFSQHVPPPNLVVMVDSFKTEVKWANWQLIIEPFTNLDQAWGRFKQVETLLAEKSESLGENYRQLDLRFKLPVLEPNSIDSVSPKSARDSN